MKLNRSSIAGLVLLVSSALSLILMFYHPTFRANSLTEFVEKSDRQFFVNALVHGGIIACIWCSLVAFTFFNDFLGWSLFLVRLACINYTLAGICMTAAALISGFIVPEYAAYHSPEPQQVVKPEIPTEIQARQYETFKTVLRLARAMNQVASRFGVVFTSLAIAIWSLTLIHEKQFPNWIAWLGILIGIGFVVGTLTGFLPMNVHGMLVFVLFQGIWSGAIGVSLMRQ